MDDFELTSIGEIRINGVSLIELVRKVELPAATAEYDQRISDGETGIYNLAGDYQFMPASMYFLPNRNLLDRPYSLAAVGFEIPDGDPLHEKATLLGCTCGIPDCWFLMVRIKLDDDFVHWSDFNQFHRDWEYDLEFTFERSSYEAQLEPTVS